MGRNKPDLLRKMGHVTVIADDIQTARGLAEGEREN
jgi:phosphoribosylaminoimidazole carboxylase (NCAIR synthetase)